MLVQYTIPIFRIFDYQKAVDFYVGWLGMVIDWEYTFEPLTPIYMQVSGHGLTLHLSEHSGDCSPAARIYINCTGIKEFHHKLIEKKYKFNRPGLEKSFYGTWCMEVIDPFGNRITFNESIEKEST